MYNILQSYTESSLTGKIPGVRRHGSHSLHEVHRRQPAAGLVANQPESQRSTPLARYFLNGDLKDLVVLEGRLAQEYRVAVLAAARRQGATSVQLDVQADGFVEFVCDLRLAGWLDNRGWVLRCRTVLRCQVLL